MKKLIFGGVLLVCLALLAPVLFAERGNSYILATHDSVSMSGGSAWPQVRDLREKLDPPFLWVSKDGREWMIRDDSTIQRAVALFEPLERFLKEEEHGVDLEERDLDKREQGLEDEEERLEDLVDEIEEEVEDRDRWTDELRDREREVERRMRELEERRYELEQGMRDLERHEREIERREEALETEAERALWKLIDDAIRDGVAVAWR